jgi:hypothetical protein
VFAVKQPRDILFSYDGSNLSLYIDGKAERRTYTLGPGTALAEIVRRVKPSELEGYRYIFYALVFVPGGCLLGLAWRNLIAQPIARAILIFIGLLVPAVLLEIVLVRVSGRATSIGNVVPAASLVLGGSLWINADSRALTTPSKSRMHDLPT